MTEPIRVVATQADLQTQLQQWRREGKRIGLVPTMGALHDGHGSLVRAAAADNDEVITTVFVNPLQFAPTEDLAAYPRDLVGDTQLASNAGATLMFAPSVEEMYPFGPTEVWTNVSVRTITALWEGAHRPGHFDGVSTVVAKLFAMAGQCSAYFGEKDFQQLAVVRRMAADLSFPIRIVGCPTLREPHGLAMSSRNRYLTDDERSRARVLHDTLCFGRDLIAHGETDAERVLAAMGEQLAAEPLVRLDYLALVDPASLVPVSTIAGPVRLLVAARVGKARLIDNIGA
jgi:pantoate--beta-alanine ligase